MSGLDKKGGSSGVLEFINDTYTKLAETTPSVDISLSATINTGGMIELTANATVLTNIVSDDVKIHYFLTLDDGTGTKNTRFQVVAISNDSFPLRNAGATGEYKQTFSIHPDWDLTDIRAVALVQNMVDQNPEGNPPNDKPILQTVMVPLSGELIVFTGDIITGPPSLVVNFTDKSVTSSQITGYLWDFTGDGANTSTSSNPTFTYSEPGTYTVKMTLNFATGDPIVRTITNMITVTPSDNVSGIVTGIWTEQHSPYIITGNINVPAGFKLRIDKGVVVKFDEGVSLNPVNGEFEIIGAVGEEVWFTTNSPAQSWGGIRVLSHTTPLTIKNAIFERSGSTVLNVITRDLIIESCMFRSNYSNGNAAVINLVGAQGSTIEASIKGGYFFNNWADETSGAGAIIISRTNLTISNSIIANNTGRSNGAILQQNSSNLNIENCTIYNNENTNTSGGTIRNQTNSNLVVHNTILGGNIVTTAGTTTTTSYSRIIGFTGTGNITTDPKFVTESEGLGYTFLTDSSHWTLADGSPCIDKGNPATDYDDIADPAKPGYALYPSKGTVRNDMGAYGGGGSNALNDNDPYDVPTPTNLAVYTYPNPFNPSLNIKLAIKNTNQRLNVAVYNIKGQKVTELYNDLPTSTNMTLLWNGKDDNNIPAASGVYFIKAYTPTEQSTQKVVLMK